MSFFFFSSQAVHGTNRIYVFCDAHLVQVQLSSSLALVGFNKCDCNVGLFLLILTKRVVLYSILSKSDWEGYINCGIM